MPPNRWQEDRPLPAEWLALFVRVTGVERDGDPACRHDVEEVAVWERLEDESVVYVFACTNCHRARGGHLTWVEHDSASQVPAAKPPYLVRTD